MKTSVSTAAMLLLCSAGIVTFLRAGPLTPPAGPVASSYKTLTEVEPRIAINSTNTPGDADSLYKITQPGSYYLTGNITGAVDKHGIKITASGVTIDLNGFDLAGVPGPGSFSGVSAGFAGLTGIAIRNGSVRNWDHGIDLGSLPVSGSRIEDIRATANLLDGIWVGPQSIVTGCAVDGASDGIYSYNESVISNCSVTNTGTVAIRVQDGGTIIGCSATGNAGLGFNGTNGCTITSCSAANNGTDGFHFADGCTISSCSASGNLGSGIVVSNGGNITSCSARGNSVNGITANNFGFISACTVLGNALAGIQVNNQSRVVSNECAGAGETANLSRALYVGGTFNQIDGNLFTNANRGVRVDLSANFFVRNRAVSNVVNWDIALGGNWGQFVAPLNGAAFSGSVGGAALGTTDPWVNFSN